MPIAESTVPANPNENSTSSFRSIHHEKTVFLLFCTLLLVIALFSCQKTSSQNSQTINNIESSQKEPLSDDYYAKTIDDAKNWILTFSENTTDEEQETTFSTYCEWDLVKDMIQTIRTQGLFPCRF